MFWPSQSSSWRHCTGEPTETMRGTAWSISTDKPVPFNPSMASHYSRFSVFSVPLDSFELSDFPGLVFLLIIFIICIERIQCSKRPLVLLQLFLGLFFYNLEKDNSATGLHLSITSSHRPLHSIHGHSQHL